MQAQGWDWNSKLKTKSTPLIIYEETPVDTDCSTGKAIGLEAGSNDEIIDDVSAEVESVSGEGKGVEADSSDESPVRKVRLLKDIYESCIFTLNVCDPSSYKETVKTKVWREAMREELGEIERNGTWGLMEPPLDKKIVQLKWVYKTNYLSDGRIQRHKAR
ncbi:uncharacterized mitochondrial protein AtMg00820-like [Dioscorea cayenensis subsp. rotundata]|uniref:Uncharacterized mitochondrial protein AtMg00820-like n=1 Tax=Dioscorea cayennensis subsp. rotundata TaxID=55577 RepID=A0AB40C974_DIOCR|nr:uncharacterized mitochondrial protein AtMg00820-like [Dioscorea cayenensis subsp. rotundata]